MYTRVSYVVVILDNYKTIAFVVCARARVYMAKKRNKRDEYSVYVLNICVTRKEKRTLSSCRTVIRVWWWGWEEGSRKKYVCFFVSREALLLKVSRRKHENRVHVFRYRNIP